MSSVLVVAFGFLLLVCESAISTILPIYTFAPNLMLPIVILLGVSAEGRIMRGATISFVLGYLMDSFCGSPMGLQTFVLTASFMLARSAGTRLFPQGPVFQVLLTFLMAIAFGATVLALRAIFEESSGPVLGDSARETLKILFGSAAASALVSPLVFAVTRRLLSLGTIKREARTILS